MACLGSHSYSDGDVNLIYNIYDIYLYYILLYVYILYDTISYADNIVSQVPTVIHGMVHSQDVSLRSQEETSRLRSFGAAAAGGPDGGNGHGVMRVKQCHVYHPWLRMVIKHTTYKNGDDWGMATMIVLPTLNFMWTPKNALVHWFP